MIHPASRTAQAALLVALLACAPVSEPSAPEPSAPEASTSEVPPASFEPGPPAVELDFAALEEAAEAWESLGETSRAAEAFEDLAKAYTLHRRYEKALSAWDRAIDHRDALGHAAMGADGRNRRGLLLHSLDRPEAARRDFEQALEIFEDQDRPRHRASALNNLGLLDRDAGRFQDARSSFLSALESLDEMSRLGPPGEVQRALILENLARLETVQGRFHQAQRYLERAETSRARSDDPQSVVETRLEIAWLHLLEGRPAEALSILDPMVEQARGRAARTALVFHDRRGTALEALGEIASAREAYRRAEEIARHLEDPGLLGGVLNNLCRLAVRHPETTADASDDLCTEALAIMRAAGDANRLATSLYWRGRQLEKRGAFAEASELYEEASTDLERMTDHVVGPEGRSRFAEERSDPLRRLVEVSMTMHWRDPSAGHDERALLASERLRARGVLERLRDADFEPTELVKNPEARRRHRELVETIGTLEAALDSPLQGSRGPVEPIRERLGAALEELDAVEQELRETSPAYGELRPPRDRPLSAYQAELDPRTAVLGLLLGEERSTLWILTRDSLVTRELPSGKTLERSTRDFLQALARFDPYATWSTGERLAENLFGPGRERLDDLETYRLVFLGDGGLQQLPLSALPAGFTDGGDRRYLVDDHEVVHLPSLNTLVAIRQLDRAPARRAIAIFADPIYHYRRDSGLDLEALDAEETARIFGPHSPAEPAGRLPFTDREAEWIEEIFLPGTRRVDRGLDANRERALDPELADYAIVHFAAHGQLDPSHPERLSALLLSQFDAQGQRVEGRLRALDIRALEWRAELVVASACQTGVGGSSLEGVGGLARSFFQAGAPRTIASLWNVPSEPTAHFMRAFYRALAAGAAPSAALREARLELLGPPGDERRGTWTQPHVWGAFVLVGDWRSFESPEGSFAAN